MSGNLRSSKTTLNTKPRDTKPWYILRDSKGYGSITMTMAFIAFWVTTFAFLFSTIESIGEFRFRQFDTAACSAYLIPILTLYFGRKWTDAKVSKTEQEEK